MTVSEENPLLSSHNSSGGLRVLLHPLVLLTISDYITRHNLRQVPGPIAGALLGQQLGREITLEHAFECKLMTNGEGEVIMSPDWFYERLSQFKLVHKAPALELVGWFTITPASGPQPQHLPIHRQLSENYNESAILLAFHPSEIELGASNGGKLPLTIYESVYEASSSDSAAGNADRQMDSEAEEIKMNIRFRELPYTMETGEAEMIGVDFVAKGSGNAAVDEPKSRIADATRSSTSESRDVGKGKGKVLQVAEDGPDTSDISVSLSTEDEELITTLSARTNAIKMLHSRIRLIKTYLAQLPPSYLTAYNGNGLDDRIDSPTGDDDGDDADAEINLPALRSIQALVNRLPLVVPANKEAFEEERLAERNDVSLVSLLGALSKSVRDAKEVGRKFKVGVLSPRHILHHVLDVVISFID
ncbi:MAG: hypothetical protein M1825_005116 [Sarcosagium campestre]|nr:MAG: hypothetical protein M1825_005116 [Sarcosagium campestre]